MSQIRYLLGITGIVSLYGIASLGVWLLGSSLGLSVTVEIVIIALILLTLPFAILIHYFVKRRARKREAAAAAAEAGQQKQDQAAPTAKRVYEDLSRGAEEAVQWLRSTRLGGAKSKEAVYGLPWFVVAGPPSSGKTSLLLGSGLDFHGLPSQRRAELKIVRPTSHCEWRITDAAVLLDTSGRYQTDSPARDEWIALAELIKKYRGTRPIDGFLVAVDAQRVLKSSETEIEQQAKILRARLDELIRLVGIRFPVYLLFTHVDSLPGFKDFFSRGNYGSEVWGATIPLDKSANAHALFDVEFDQLYDSLSRKRLLRLRAPAPADRQLKVFDFPLRFGEARSKLGLLVSALFRPNPFSESPLLRGFYFTANVKDGDSAAARVPAQEDGGERPAQAVGNAFFSNRFFNDVLLRDKDLATSFLALKKRPPRLRSFLIAAATLIVFLLMIGAAISFFGNKSLIADTLERGARADEIRRADLGKDPTKKDPTAARVEVEATDSLREALVRLDDYDRNSPPFFLRFGLYSGNDINPSLRTIYFELIAQRYFNPTTAAIERDLQAFATGSVIRNASLSQDAPAPSEEDVLGRNYDLLKAYLMLADPQKVEPTFLASQLQDYWKKTSPPDMEIVSLQQLDFFARQAASDDAPHIRVNDRLVSEVRRKLTAYPPVNRFYKRVVTEINAKTTPVSLDSVLEGRGRGVLAGTYTVPGSFTIDGYRNYMKAAIDTAGEEISKDDWVMGTAASTAQTQSTDISKLQRIYLLEYTDQWRRFERGISVQQLRGKDDAVEVLKVLSSTESPMERVMSEVARNTNLSAKPESRGVWGWIKGLFSRGGRDETGGTTEVEKEFRPLFQFVSSGDSKKDSSPMSQYRAELRKLLDGLENTSADQLTQTSKTLLTGKDDIGLQRAEQNVGKLLDGFKTAAGEDTAKLLKQPLNNVRAMIYGGEYERIEKAWREQIYPKAQAIESGFPFTDTGASSVTDLSRYLNPSNGLFTNFFKEQLATSFDDVEGQWRLKETGAFKFSDDFVKYLNDARRLRESLFPNGGQQPEVAYDITLQPVPNTDIVIEIDGTRVETRGTSPQSSKFTWPAKTGSSGAKITVIPASGEPVERSFPSEWGLFKLFEAGAHGQSGVGPYNLSWDVGSVPVRAVLRPSSANNPFSRRVFTSLHAPQSVQR